MLHKGEGMSWAMKQLQVLKRSPKGMEPVLILAISPENHVVVGTMERDVCGHLFMEDAECRFKNSAVGKKSGEEFFDERLAEQIRLTTESA